MQGDLQARRAAMDLCEWRASGLRGGRGAVREAEALAASFPEDGELAGLLEDVRRARAEAVARRRSALARIGLPALPAALVPVLLSLVVGLSGLGEPRALLLTSSPLPGPERRAVLSLGPFLGEAPLPDAADVPASPGLPAPAVPPAPSPVPPVPPPANLGPPAHRVEEETLAAEVEEGDPGEAPLAVDRVVQKEGGGGAGPGGGATGRRVGRHAGPSGGGRAVKGQGGGEGFVALREDAPMAFLRLGGAAADRRSARVGLFVARTEVSQAQWVAVHGLDLGSTSGHHDHPAEAMSWCEALRYANALSRREGRRPAYRVGEDCEAGGEIRWDEQSDGFRLLTEEEWEALADGGQRGGEAGPAVARINNRGLGHVDLGGEDQQHGLIGLRDNAREWVWGRAEHRAVARGCSPSEEEPCRLLARPADVPLGVGLRLASGAP